ncbi:MAG: S24 family peptidase [Gammaproteobacteria bacterium]|nr:S24 family peptidase [Gammaproteobacteria bacterium]
MRCKIGRNSNYRMQSMANGERVTPLEAIPIVVAQEQQSEEGGGCEEREPYALMNIGDSMEPEFNDGDVIIIEPEFPPRSGHYVIAWHNGEYTFRQLLQQEQGWILHPLNPRYEDQPLASLEAVKGVISQKKAPGRRVRGVPPKSYL